MKKIIIGAVIILIVITLGYFVVTLLASLFRAEPVADTGSVLSSQTVDERNSITVQKIIDDPQVYENVQVTVVGEIEDWVSKKAFRLDGDQPLGEGLLVIARDDFPNPDTVPVGTLALGDVVRVEVSGTVRSFSRDELERTFATELEDEIFANYENEPVLVLETARQLN